ncbi:MAG: hypothetical protein ACLP1X_10975, partial [Polyangiaceae bacterium]
MAEIIQGDGTAPQPTVGGGTRIPIASTTNTTPVAVATDVAHGFYSGDTVELEGASSLSGVHIITVTGTEGFTLNGTTAPGWVGGSGVAYVTDWSVQPAFEIPNAGEPVSMTTMAPIIQGLANTIPWNYRNSGKYKLAEQYFALILASQSCTTPDGGGGFPSWAALSAISTLTVVPYSGTSLDQILNAGAGPSPILGPSDLIDITYTLSFNLWSATPDSVFSCMFLISTFAPNGAALGVLGTTTTAPYEVETNAP